MYTCTLYMSKNRNTDQWQRKGRGAEGAPPHPQTMKKGGLSPFRFPTTLL